MCGGGGGEIIYLSLHCHHQNDSCINAVSVCLCVGGNVVSVLKKYVS